MFKQCFLGPRHRGTIEPPRHLCIMSHACCLADGRLPIGLQYPRWLLVLSTASSSGGRRSRRSSGISTSRHRDEFREVAAATGAMLSGPRTSEVGNGMEAQQAQALLGDHPGPQAGY
jgi:hypothetical protein